MRRPRLKLITIPWELEVPTLSLASIAAVTPPQFDIAIVDVLRERLRLDEAVDLVGISASTPRAKLAYAIADHYRRAGATVVMGGHHATAMPDEALEHCDAVVCGEGETSWRRLCDEFLTAPTKVRGIYSDPAPDPAELPQPRVDLMKIERYGWFTYPIIASRGCPEVCSFCFAKRMTHGYRTYPIAHVIEQVRRRPAFVRAMYFVDDNLAGDIDYTRELFSELKKYKVPFGMQVRHEFSRNSDDLELAREAGCTLISSGYESINQTTLRRTGKRALAEDYAEIIGNIFRAGILPSGNWMLGFDWDTPDIFDATLEFLDKTDLMHCSFTSEIPFPGTDAFKRYHSEGRILTHDYDDYTGKDAVVIRPAQMTPEQLQAGIRRLALSFYSVRRSMRRARRAMGNPRLTSFGPKVVSAPALMFLNLHQVWQWGHRMSPPLNWLYEQLMAANKYRYVGDVVKRTNFHSRAPRAARNPEGSATFRTQSPFLHRGGHKARRTTALLPIIGSSESRAAAKD